MRSYYLIDMLLTYHIFVVAVLQLCVAAACSMPYFED
jgi:hypothetical protein